MSATLVVQSHQSPLPYSWLSRCLDSVRGWCELNGFEYRFLGDELFDLIPRDLLKKLKDHRVIAADLARLHIARNALLKGYDTVVWLDADFLIFDAPGFNLPEQPYAVGREVWVQPDREDRLRVYKKVHNAFLMFRRGNSFLDFYIETAERLLIKNQGGIPPQFIGPKLLTALHNVVQLPVMESAGMLSPPVIKAIVHGNHEALNMFTEHSACSIAGANLCISSREREEVTCAEIERLIDTLINNRVFSN